MIVPMQRIAVLCTASSEKDTLDALQSLGVLHISQTPSAEAPALHEAQEALDNATKALQLVTTMAADLEKEKANLPPAPAGATPEAIVADAARLDATLAERAALQSQINRYAPFGDFDPAQAVALGETGLTVRLFRTPPGAKEPEAKNGGIVSVLTAPSASPDKATYGAIIGDAELGEMTEIVPLPEQSLKAMEAEADKLATAIADMRAKLAACAALSAKLSATIAERTTIRDFAAAQASMGAQDGVLWLEGYTPDDRLPALREAAKANGWGLAAREPSEDENPPTLLRPPKIFRPITLLFKMLGIVPGYREVDMSVIFYSFFTLFFAMLVGDAGYGVLILLATLYFRKKCKKAPAAPFILMTVFGAATTLWGILSATYFGIQTDVLPSFMNHPVAQWLNGNEHQNIMQLCFMIGAIHLTIARLWSAGNLFPNRKFLAEVGWTGIIWTMYCASCMVVIDGFAFPTFMYYVAGVSALLIALFMLDKSELKEHGAELGMLPLNNISALGDIISYVRLFAVGLSSVMLAQNFNAMALDLQLPIIAKIPCVILILFIGHAMNLAMGALSILVHAVRLNTLEFSNHKGITWSGYDYNPFRR